MYIAWKYQATQKKYGVADYQYFKNGNTQLSYFQT